ncbi:uncharacterized protein IWZ02DRAFT_52424 [Phyllosticta citriasiana]|uniref:uncharacterized protein n=1 Tax=Phyllosticta citriasiana TaxID=595635 RepID=UPI0030FD6F19
MIAIMPLSRPYARFLLMVAPVLPRLAAQTSALFGAPSASPRRRPCFLIFHLPLPPLLLTTTQPRNHAPTPALAWLAPATRMHTCTALTHGRPSFPSHVPLVQSAVCRRLKFEPCPSHFARRDKPWTHLPCPILERIAIHAYMYAQQKAQQIACLPRYFPLSSFLYHVAARVPNQTPIPASDPSDCLPSSGALFGWLVGWLHVGVWPANGD